MLRETQAIKMEEITMKKTRITAGSVGVVLLVLLALTPAAAVEVKLSGQIDRAIMWADNGNDTDILHVDNTNSSTRFRLVGEQAFDNVTVGVVWESEFASNASSKVDIGQDDDGDTAVLGERKLEAWFGGAFGKVWIGQGDGAANYTSETDLSGTSLIMYSSVTDTAGGIYFRDDDDNAIATVGATRSNFDGLSRNDRLRYDTPVFAGFTASASATNGNAWEVALRWAQEFDGLGKLAASIGHVNSNGRDNVPDFHQTGASASWLHPTGINLTIAYGTKDIEKRSGDDPVSYYGKLGYKWDIHALAVEYGVTNDLAREDDDSSNYGVAYVITPWSGVEFFGAYRVYDLDRKHVDTNAINQILVGTRVVF
jgi:hypothetical protein